MGSVVAAALLLAVMTHASPARRLSVSERNFRDVFAAFTLFDQATTINIECPLTLEGSFHSSTYAKVLAALIGHITRAVANHPACSGGMLTALIDNLPWAYGYQGFEGSLPSLPGWWIAIRGIGVRAELGFGVVCDYQASSSPPSLRIQREARGGQTVTSWVRGTAIPLVEGGISCPPEVEFGGAAEHTRLGNTRPVEVTLI